MFRETLEQSFIVFIWGEKKPQKVLESPSHHSKGRRTLEGRSVIYVRAWLCGRQECGLRESVAVWRNGERWREAKREPSILREQDAITGLYCWWLCHWTETSWRLCRKNSTASTFPFLSKTDSVNLLSLWENDDQESTRLHLLREAQPCGVAGKRGVMGRCYFKCNNLRFSGKGKTGRFIFWRHILGSTTMLFFKKLLSWQ